MKFTASIAVVVIIIVAIAGVGIGYVAGGAGAASRTTTQYSTATQTTTQTTTLTTTPNLAGFWTTAYSASWQYYMVSDATLVNLLNAGNSSIYLLDVRPAASYAAGHIASAINVPFANMTAAVNSNSLPKNKIIIAICFLGETSGETMVVLRALGYNAYFLGLGMSGWNNATRSSAAAPIALVNYPIVTGTAPGTWTVFTS